MIKSFMVLEACDEVPKNLLRKPMGGSVQNEDLLLREYRRR
jgi:hypothetical protein